MPVLVKDRGEVVEGNALGIWWSRNYRDGMDVNDGVVCTNCTCYFALVCAIFQRFGLRNFRQSVMRILLVFV